jgi:hypothetical protein
VASCWPCRKCLALRQATWVHHLLLLSLFHIINSVN